MQRKYLGDSFDLVKRFLLQTLAPDAHWVTPKRYIDLDDQDITNFERLTGVHVIKDQGLLSTEQYVFIDPNTGIAIEKPAKQSHVHSSYLMELCRDNPKRLLLVFDQSFSYNEKRIDAIRTKLDYFANQNISCFYYYSHACFLVLSASSSVCSKARTNLLKAGLPEDRLK